MVEPNARDCEHGQLRRACRICELEAEVAELREKIAILEGFIRAFYEGSPIPQVDIYGHVMWSGGEKK